MTMIVHKDRDTIGCRFAIGRNTPRRVAYLLGVFLCCAVSTAAAVDSDTWHYGLDNVGNITSRGTDSQNPTHNYDYDGIYRLTDETNPSNTDKYSYDSNGNRTSFTRDGTSTSYQIESSSNRLTQVGSDPRTYDNIGNTKTDRNGSRTFTYNEAGRLVQVHENGQLLATYTYNAQGQRTIKTTPSGTTYYLYGGGGQLIGEYDETGQPIKEYVHLNGEPIAQLESSNITYLHSDHLATPRKATNETGDVVWKWDSEAFGNKLPESSGGTTVNLRFPGQYYDGESGLYYNYYRYYDPNTGRYITSDPIGLEGGLNTYAYVDGNPLIYFDPLGLICRKTTRRGTRCKPDEPGPMNECTIKCFARREVICSPYRAGGVALGYTVAGIASIPSNGAAFSGLSKAGRFFGGLTGKLACEALLFEESCFEECDDGECE